MEDVQLPDDYVPPEVEPVYAPLDPDFEVLSDEEYIEDAGELEDNFVELAGGKHTRMEDDEVDENDEKEKDVTPQPPSFHTSASLLPMHKVKMMERFLFGTESTEEDNSWQREFSQEHHCIPAPSTTVASMRKGRVLTDQEELLEKQFDKVCCCVLC